MTDTNQLPPHTVTINDHPEPHIMQWSELELAAIKKYAESYALQALAQATQAEVTDAEIDAVTRQQWGEQLGVMFQAHRAYARAILALRPAAVPMTDEVFDLICNAIDKADTISMEGDYMLDSDDCIAVVRVMQALLSAHHGITAQAKKETP